jgi:hypothetical protein
MREETSIFKRLNAKLPVPFGCIGIIILGIIVFTLLIRGCILKEEENSKKYQAYFDAQRAAYKSKFNYDIDSVASLAIGVTSGGQKSGIIKKGITFNKYGDKYLIKTEPLYQLPDDRTAYNLNDLDVVIFQEYSEERSDHNTMGKRQVLDIFAVDTRTMTVIYRNRHQANKISYTKRRSGVTSYYYNITREDVLQEMNKLFGN